jgi:putative MATE family efflux protein
MATHNLSMGSVPKLIIVMALPVLATFIMQSMYALADLYFVGRLGGAALAGLGISLQSFFLVLAVAQSIGTGALALLSQFFGRGDHAQVQRVFRQVFWLSIVVGAAFWVFGFLTAQRFVATFTEDPAVVLQGVAFLNFFTGTFFTSVVLFSMSFAFRAVGDFVVPTIMMALSVLLNVALDPVLIFGLGPIPAMGVAGAGLATLIAQCSALLGYVYIVTLSRRNKLLKLSFPIVWNWRVVGQILRIGLPSSAQNLLMMAGLLVMYKFLSPFGASATAAAGVGFRIIQTAIFPGVAISVAVASVVGQNYGAQKFSRVKSALSWGVLFVALVLSAEYIVIAANPTFWASLFAKEPEIVSIGSQYLLISGAILPLYAMSFIATFGSQGLGRTVAPLVTGIVRTALGIAATLAVDYWFGLSVATIFWIGTAAGVVEVVCMTGVIALLWRKVLNRPDSGDPRPSEAFVPVQAIPAAE